MNIALLFGGVSSEHEISCISAEYLEKQLKANGYNLYCIFIKRDASYHLCTSVKDKASSQPCTLTSKGLHFDESSNTPKVVSLDFAFSIMHGPMGEDGSLQGFFEQIRLPYAGV